MCIFNKKKKDNIDADYIKVKALTVSGSIQIIIGNTIYTVGTQEINGNKVLCLFPE